MAAGDIVVVNENSFGKKANIFDGTDDYVLHDAHGVARVAANDTVGTYMSRIYADDITTLQTILSAGDNNAAGETLEFGVNAAGELFVKLVHGSTTQFDITETTASMSSRKWHDVCVVQDGTQPVLYVDGLLVAATNDTSTDLTFWYDELTLVDKFGIGVTETNNTHLNDWTGAIGRTRYFDIAMTAAEVLRETQGKTDPVAARATVIETARVFDITMEDDGTTDAGSGVDNGTLTGNAHYGGEVSTYSLAMERNSSGHAAEFMNSFIVADRIQTIIKKGD